MAVDFKDPENEDEEYLYKSFEEEDECDGFLDKTGEGYEDDIDQVITPEQFSFGRLCDRSGLYPVQSKAPLEEMDGSTERCIR